MKSDRIVFFYQNNGSSSMFLEIFSGNVEVLRKAVMRKKKSKEWLL